MNYQPQVDKNMVAVDFSTETDEADVNNPFKNVQLYAEHEVFSYSQSCYQGANHIKHAPERIKVSYEISCSNYLILKKKFF